MLYPQQAMVPSILTRTCDSLPALTWPKAPAGAVPARSCCRPSKPRSRRSSPRKCEFRQR